MGPALQIVAGFMVGLGVIGGVFWFTFRKPPEIDPNARDSDSLPGASGFRPSDFGGDHGGFGGT